MKHADLSLLSYPSAVGADDDNEWATNVRGATQKLGLESVTFWANDCELLAAWDRHDLYFAFRGSSSGYDWATNAKLLVGGAYESSLDSVWHLVEGTLKLLGRTRKVHWTGHSKGGALASLACIRARNAGWEPSTCYTFGEPPNTTPAVAKWMQGSCDRRRYVRCQDSVARTLKLYRARGILRHWGDCFYFDRKNVLRVNHSLWWMLWDRMYDRLTKGVRLDHSMTGYLYLVKHHETFDDGLRSGSFRTYLSRQSGGELRNSRG